MRTTAVEIQQNSFWLTYLSDQLENKEDPKMILTYLNSLKDVSSLSLKQATNTYLNGMNLIGFITLA